MRKNLTTIVLMAVALMAVFFLTFHLHQTSKEKVISQFNENQLLIAQQVARQIESYSRSRFQDLRWLSSLASLQDLDKEKIASDIQSHFERLKMIHVTEISLLDEKGTVAYSTTAGARGANHSQADFFSWAKAPGNKGSVRMGYEKADGQRRPMTAGSPTPPHPRIFLVTPLYRESAHGGQQKPGGKFAGVILCRVDLEKMLAERSVLFTPLMKMHGLWIMNRDGTLLLQSEHREMVMRNIREKDETCNQCHASFDYVEKMPGKAEGVTEYQIKGEKKKTAAFTSMSFANASWIVVVNAPLDEVTAFVQTHFRETLIILGITTFVLGLAFYSAYRNYRRRVDGEMEVRRLHDRQKLTEELRETRDYLENLFNYANAPIIVWSPEFRINRFNRAFERLTGYAAGEVIGRELQMLFPEGSREESLSLIARTLSGEYWESVEIPILRKDGNTRLALWNSANIHDKDGATLIATIAQGQDITERKQAERDLRHRIQELDVLYKISRASTHTLNLHERLNNTVEATIAALRVDAASIYLLEPDGRTMTMRAHCGLSNEFFRDAQKINFGEGISGRAAADGKVIVLNVSDYPLERLVPVIVREGFQVLASAPLTSSDKMIGALNLGMRHPRTFTPEEMRLLEALGQMLGQAVRNVQLYESVQQELVERKRAMEELRETRDYLENLFGYANAPIIVWDQGFKITRFNRAFERLTGYMAEEVIGKNLQILFPDSSRAESLVQIKSTLIGAYWESVEIPILRKDGGIRTALWNSANIYTTDGATLVATIAQGQDITERKQQTTDLIHANREKALLLKEIHHRVKNNLQIIASLLRLSTKYSGDERIEEIFRESQDRIRAMAAVHSMLYKSENFADINFGEYIRETARQLFRSYNTNPEAISLMINAEDVMLSIDTAIPCGLIINELVSNALKHAFPDGRRGEIRIEMRQDENGVRIIFEDNGAGFPEGMDFRNTETLGLQLVNMLVAQLDGAIEMVRNGGTRYVITLKTGGGI